MEREQLAQEIIDRLYHAHIASIAEAANVTPGALYHWMSGHVLNPRLPTLIRVGEALGMKLQWKNTRRLRSVA
ncbi:MAG: hypothetical protein ACRBBW_16245 [Cellvibrionaceae bacterium]